MVTAVYHGHATTKSVRCGNGAIAQPKNPTSFFHKVGRKARTRQSLLGDLALEAAKLAVSADSKVV